MSLPFDPRLMPKVPLPEGQGGAPVVSPDVLHPQALRSRFTHPPVWHPDTEAERWPRTGASVPASVLVPLVWRQPQSLVQGSPNEGGLSVLLTQRTPHLKAHAGQISFPGGRSEPHDADAVATALRESHEEVGLHPDRVEVIGRLPTYITGTGFVVTPVVGIIHAHAHEAEQLDLRADPSEVDEIFEVPLPFLMNPAHHERRVVQMGEQEFGFYAMPWWPPGRAEDYFIWGATAAMLRNFYLLLSA
jgi:8-oxo-dGTP pyrophosphatase MutT (NUDIX family)